MAKPTDFPQANFKWMGWKGENGEPDVADLPAWQGDCTTVSCWTMSWRERLAVLFSGRVWLSVMGRHPPVCVEGTCPLIPATTETPQNQPLPEAGC